MVAALRRYGDIFDLKTGSIIIPSRNGHDADGDPFHHGFIEGMEERTELVKRMISRLEIRERLLLVLWYVSELPVTNIAVRMRLSRMHCYRLRKGAIDSLCDEPPPPSPREQRQIERAQEASGGSRRRLVYSLGPGKPPRY